MSFVSFFASGLTTATVSYSSSNTGATVEISQVVGFPKFDPALGTLIGVTVHLTIDFWAASQSVTKSGGAPTGNVRLTSAVDTFFSSPIYSLYSELSVLDQYQQIQTTLQSISAGQTATWADASTSLTTDLVFTGAVFSDVTGSTGTIGMQADTLSGTSVLGSGILSSFSDMTAAFSATIDYTYTY